MAQTPNVVDLQKRSRADSEEGEIREAHGGFGASNERPRMRRDFPQGPGGGPGGGGVPFRDRSPSRYGMYGVGSQHHPHGPPPPAMGNFGAPPPPPHYANNMWGDGGAGNIHHGRGPMPSGPHPGAGGGGGSRRFRGKRPSGTNWGVGPLGPGAGPHLSSGSEGPGFEGDNWDRGAGGAPHPEDSGGVGARGGPGWHRRRSSGFEYSRDRDRERDRHGGGGHERDRDRNRDPDKYGEGSASASGHGGGDFGERKRAERDAWARKDLDFSTTRERSRSPRLDSTKEDSSGRKSPFHSTVKPEGSCRWSSKERERDREREGNNRTPRNRERRWDQSSWRGVSERSNKISEKSPSIEGEQVNADKPMGIDIVSDDVSKTVATEKIPPPEVESSAANTATQRLDVVEESRTKASTSASVSKVKQETTYTITDAAAEASIGEKREATSENDYDTLKQKGPGVLMKPGEEAITAEIYTADPAKDPSSSSVDPSTLSQGGAEGATAGKGVSKTNNLSTNAAVGAVGSEQEHDGAQRPKFNAAEAAAALGLSATAAAMFNMGASGEQASADPGAASPSSSSKSSRRESREARRSSWPSVVATSGSSPSTHSSFQRSSALRVPPSRINTDSEDWMRSRRPLGATSATTPLASSTPTAASPSSGLSALRPQDLGAALRSPSKRKPRLEWGQGLASRSPHKGSSAPGRSAGTPTPALGGEWSVVGGAEKGSGAIGSPVSASKPEKQGLGSIPAPSTSGTVGQADAMAVRSSGGEDTTPRARQPVSEIKDEKVAATGARPSTKTTSPDLPDIAKAKIGSDDTSSAPLAKAAAKAPAGSVPGPGGLPTASVSSAQAPSPLAVAVSTVAASLVGTVSASSRAMPSQTPSVALSDVASVRGEPSAMPRASSSSVPHLSLPFSAASSSMSPSPLVSSTVESSTVASSSLTSPSLASSPFGRSAGSTPQRRPRLEWGMGLMRSTTPRGGPVGPSPQSSKERERLSEGDSASAGVEKSPPKSVAAAETSIGDGPDAAAAAPAVTAATTEPTLRERRMVKPLGPGEVLAVGSTFPPASHERDATRSTHERGAGSAQKLGLGKDGANVSEKQCSTAETSGVKEKEDVSSKGETKSLERSVAGETEKRRQDVPSDCASPEPGAASARKHQLTGSSNKKLNSTAVVQEQGAGGEGSESLTVKDKESDRLESRQGDRGEAGLELGEHQQQQQLQHAAKEIELRRSNVEKAKLEQEQRKEQQSRREAELERTNVEEDRRKVEREQKEAEEAKRELERERKAEQELQRREEERAKELERRREEEKKREEEEKKKKIEKEKKREEEKKKREEERRKREEEKKREEEEKKREEQRKREQEYREREEEQRKREKEQRKREEERRKAEETQKRREEVRKKREEEQKTREEERRMKDEEKRKKKEEKRLKEEEKKRAEQESKQLEEEKRKKVEAEVEESRRREQRRLEAAEEEKHRRAAEAEAKEIEEKRVEEKRRLERERRLAEEVKRQEREKEAKERKKMAEEALVAEKASASAASDKALGTGEFVTRHAVSSGVPSSVVANDVGKAGGAAEEGRPRPEPTTKKVEKASEKKKDEGSGPEAVAATANTSCSISNETSSIRERKRRPSQKTEELASGTISSTPRPFTAPSTVKQTTTTVMADEGKAEQGREHVSPPNTKNSASVLEAKTRVELDQVAARGGAGAQEEGLETVRPAETQAKSPSLFSSTSKGEGAQKSKQSSNRTSPQQEEQGKQGEEGDGEEEGQILKFEKATAKETTGSFKSIATGRRGKTGAERSVKAESTHAADNGDVKMDDNASVDETRESLDQKNAEINVEVPREAPQVSSSAEKAERRSTSLSAKGEAERGGGDAQKVVGSAEQGLVASASRKSGEYLEDVSRVTEEANAEQDAKTTMKPKVAEPTAEFIEPMQKERRVGSVKQEKEREEKEEARDKGSSGLESPSLIAPTLAPHSVSVSVSPHRSTKSEKREREHDLRWLQEREKKASSTPPSSGRSILSLLRADPALTLRALQISTENQEKAKSASATCMAPRPDAGAFAQHVDTGCHVTVREAGLRDTDCATHDMLSPAENGPLYLSPMDAPGVHEILETFYANRTSLLKAMGARKRRQIKRLEALVRQYRRLRQSWKAKLRRQGLLSSRASGGSGRRDRFGKPTTRATAEEEDFVLDSLGSEERRVSARTASTGASPRTGSARLGEGGYRALTRSSASRSEALDHSETEATHSHASSSSGATATASFSAVDFGVGAALTSPAVTSFGGSGASGPSFSSSFSSASASFSSPSSSSVSISGGGGGSGGSGSSSLFSSGGERGAVGISGGPSSRSSYDQELLLLSSMTEEEKRAHRYKHSLAAIPDQLLAHDDRRTCAYRENHNSRLATDGDKARCAHKPLQDKCEPRCNCARAAEVERRRVSPWSDIEKLIFIDKFLQYPKNFHKIASFLTNKSTSDAIEFYYLYKQKIDFKLLLREQQLRRRGGRKTWALTAHVAASLGIELPQDFVQRSTLLLLHQTASSPRGGMAEEDLYRSLLDKNVFSKINRPGFLSGGGLEQYDKVVQDAAEHSSSNNNYKDEAQRKQHGKFVESSLLEEATLQQQPMVAARVAGKLMHEARLEALSCAHRRREFHSSDQHSDKDKDKDRSKDRDKVGGGSAGAATAAGGGGVADADVLLHSGGVKSEHRPRQSTADSATSPNPSPVLAPARYLTDILSDCSYVSHTLSVLALQEKQCPPQEEESAEEILRRKALAKSIINGRWDEGKGKGHSGRGRKRRRGGVERASLKADHEGAERRRSSGGKETDTGANPLPTVTAQASAPTSSAASVTSAASLSVEVSDGGSKHARAEEEGRRVQPRTQISPRSTPRRKAAGKDPLDDRADAAPEPALPTTRLKRKRNAERAVGKEGKKAKKTDKSSAATAVAATAVEEKPKKAPATVETPLKDKKDKKLVESAAASVSAKPAKSPEPVVEKRALQKWNDAEKETFLRIFSEHGKDWTILGSEIPTKTSAQIKNYYQNYKNRLGLQDILKRRNERLAKSNAAPERGGKRSSKKDKAAALTATGASGVSTGPSATGAKAKSAQGKEEIKKSGAAGKEPAGMKGTPGASPRGRGKAADKGEKTKPGAKAAAKAAESGNKAAAKEKEGKNAKTSAAKGGAKTSPRNLTIEIPGSAGGQAGVDVKAERRAPFLPPVSQASSVFAAYAPSAGHGMAASSLPLQHHPMRSHAVASSGPAVSSASVIVSSAGASAASGAMWASQAGPSYASSYYHHEGGPYAYGHPSDAEYAYHMYSDATSADRAKNHHYYQEMMERESVQGYAAMADPHTRPGQWVEFQDARGHPRYDVDQYQAAMSAQVQMGGMDLRQAGAYHNQAHAHDSSVQDEDEADHHGRSQELQPGDHGGGRPELDEDGRGATYAESRTPRHGLMSFSSILNAAQSPHVLSDGSTASSPSEATPTHEDAHEISSTVNVVTVSDPREGASSITQSTVGAAAEADIALVLAQMKGQF